MSTEIWLALLFFVAGGFITIISLISENSIFMTIAILIFMVAITFFMASFLRVKNFFRRKLPLCCKKKVIENSGVFGRDKLIDDIIEWHNRDDTNKVALISGAAGSGKTTLALALKNCVIDSSSVYVIDKGNEFYTKISDITEIKDNCIIVFDYVLESINQIESYLEQLYRESTHNKKISVILLERDAATSVINRICQSKGIKIFHINLDEYKLNKNTLAYIIEFNVSNVSDVEAQNNIISHEEAQQIAGQITNYIDKELKRPIFATILATIYRRKKSFNYIVYDYDTVFFEYWEVVTGFRKILSDEDLNTEATINYIKLLKNYVKLISILTTITSLKIRCCPIGNNLDIRLFDKSDKEETNRDILGLVIEALELYYVPDANIINWLPFLYYHNHKICKEPKGIYILPLNLDMFSSWMLYHTMKEDKKQLAKWLDTISKVKDNKYYSETYMFVIRASEIFGYEIFDFFQTIDVPRYSQLYRWKRDFATDINLILDAKSKKPLDDIMKVFEERYSTFLKTIHNSNDIQRITQDIIDMIEAAGDQAYDHEGYDRLVKWAERKKEEMGKVGLVLK